MEILQEQMIGQFPLNFQNSRNSQQNTSLKIFAKLQNNLMLLSYLEAERFVLLAQNSRFQLKRELPFGTRKKQENMRKW